MHETLGIRHRRAVLLLALLVMLFPFSSHALSGVKARSSTFVFSPKKTPDKPKLILIGGCPGTGKSTFGMSVALDQGILKCVSTDTVRAVMRSYVPLSICPALHRSSYAPAGEDGDDDPVKSWRETCRVLETSLSGLVDDAIDRGVGLVLEGVSIIPSTGWIQKWEEKGGVAVGILLTVSNEEIHKSLLLRRGFITGKNGAEDKKIRSFDRVRLIQEAMIKRAEESGWLQIEQKIEPDPLEMVASQLLGKEDALELNERVQESHAKTTETSRLS